MGEGVGGLSRSPFRARWCKIQNVLVCCTVAVLCFSISGTVFYTGTLCLFRAISSHEDQLCFNVPPTAPDTRSIRLGTPFHAGHEREGMSIYYIKSEFGALQYAYVFHNLCYNGTHMITTSDACVEPDDAFRDSTIVPLPCKEQLAFNALRRQVPWQTEFKNFSAQTIDWINVRSKISWRPGTSAALYLGPATTNVAHFLAKVNALHILNNATLPAFADTVNRFFILRHRMTTRLFDKRIDGIHGFHGPNGFLAVVLADILAAALGGQNPTPKELVLTTSTAGGMVELDKPFWDATDEQPLCFEKVVLFSLLKGAYWPGGTPVADIVRARLKERLFTDQAVTKLWPDLPKEKQEVGDSSRRLRLLYIFRLNTRRVFSDASESAFRQFLSNLPGYHLSIVDFKPLQFKDQFAAVQEADVVICLHGANLVNPTTFGKKNLVVVELLPFKVVHRMYESQAINTGLVYLGLPCSQGPTQQEDHKFDALNGTQCMSDASCKLYFVHTRHIHLTGKDFTRIQEILWIAKLLATTIDSQVFSAVAGVWDCKDFMDGYDPSNNRPWLSYKVYNSSKICYIDESREYRS